MGDDELIEVVLEGLQKKQQRFDAALKFATSSILFGDTESGMYRQPNLSEAVEMADELIAELEETRTKGT